MKESFEQAKYNVTRNVFIFTSVSMSVLALVNLFTKGDNLATAITAVIFSSTMMLFLLKTKTYLLPAFVAIILGYSLNLFNLFRESNFENYVDLFWLINLSLFAYFTLGRIIGHIYLLINLSSLLIISILVKIGELTLVPASHVYNINTYLDLTVNLTICTTFFGYIISQFLKQTHKAKSQALNSNLELQKQYDEKSIMLKEIHHRVKNNLQVITSLLRLQLFKIDNEETAAPFNESIDRISSMALIHEKMYKGDKIRNIDLKEYIEDLSNNLLNNYANNKSISLEINSMAPSIDLSHIVPLSLIINELISNSLKHAFRHKETGHISINIALNPQNNLTFCYKDNGEWKQPKDKNSFGLELIETFTEQLNGTYTFKSINGTEYCFTFKDITIKP